jgi:multisubunit Na+/H+ antiporter MnhG subunit
LPKTNSFATAGLIFGILSLTCCCGCPFNILGLVFSLIGLLQINRHPELYEGRGLAIAGLILSVASLVLAFGLALLHSAFHPPNIGWYFKSF